MKLTDARIKSACEEYDRDRLEQLEERMAAAPPVPTDEVKVKEACLRLLRQAKGEERERR